jgi:GGDEF domain-containing protein
LSIEAPREWIVLLEAEAGRRDSPLDRSEFGRLVASWAGAVPVTLCSGRRCAVQVPVVASGPQSALAGALRWWHDAVRLSDLPRWELVRVEVVTRDELARELAAADPEGEAPATAAVDDQGRLPDPLGEELLRRALLDDVTGLPGRELFLDEVRRRLEDDAAGAGVQALVVIDVADPDGTGADRRPTEMLPELAGRLTRAVRGDDCLARTGPSQLTLVVALPSNAHVGGVVTRVVEVASRPLAENGASVMPSIRVGVATASPDLDADELLAAAERATSASRVLPFEAPAR